jgi:chromosome segregation ATPase
MRQPRILPCIMIVILFTGALIGCSRGPSQADQKAEQMKQQFSELVKSEAAIRSAREELTSAKESVATIEAIAERKRTDEQKQQLEQLNASMTDLEGKVDAAYEDYQTRLADFLTLALNEFPNAPETDKALQMYATEAIYNADDIVRKSGDYKKAIDTVQSAKSYYDAIGKQPAQLLLDKLNQLDEWRYITQTRFDQLKKGMTEQEVRDTIGVPYYMNVKKDEARGITFWLYPKREGGAAAVYFDKKGKVYSMDFDAVKTRVAGE